MDIEEEEKEKGNPRKKDLRRNKRWTNKDINIQHSEEAIRKSCNSAINYLWRKKTEHSQRAEILKHNWKRT